MKTLTQNASYRQCLLLTLYVVPVAETIGTDQHCTAWCFHLSVMEVMRDVFHARLLSGLKSVGETRRLMWP